MEPSDEVKIEENDDWKTPSSKRIIKGGTILTIVNIVSSLFFTAFNIYLASWSTLSPANLSDASMLFIIDNWRLFFFYISALGFVGGGSKFMAEYLVRDKNEARVYAKSASKYNFLFIGFPFIAITIVLSMTVPQNPQEQFAYFCLIFIVVFDRLRSCPDIYLLGYQRYDYFAVSFYGPDIFTYLFGIITLPIFGFIGPVICWVISNCVGFILSMYFVSRVSDFPLSDVFDWRKEYGLAGKIIKFNLLFSLANVMFALLTTRLLLVVGGPLGFLTPNEIIAIGLISTYGNLLVNTFQIVTPILQSVSEAHSLKNPKLIENYTLLSLKFPLILSTAVIAFFMLFGPIIIVSFNGINYLVIGLFILIVIFFSYAVAAFSSKYDNILAAIGKPGVPMTPWIIGFSVGILGILLMFFLPNYYLINYTQLVGTTPVNFGLRFNFMVGSIIYYSGLIVSGIWIVILTFKVLKVQFPKSYIIKPIMAAGLTCLVLIGMNIILSPLFAALGDIIFVVIMVVIGVLIYLIILTLIGGFTREDGRFWREVFNGMGLKYPLLPVFWLGKQVLRMRNRIIKEKKSFEWILKVDNDEIKDDQIITIKTSLVKIEDPQEQKFLAKISMKKLKKPLHNFIIYITVESIKLKDSIIYIKEIKDDLEIEIDFSIPEKIKPGMRDVRVCFEMHDEPREFLQEEKNITKEKHLKSGLWTWFDYRMKWYHENIFRFKIK